MSLRPVILHRLHAAKVKASTGSDLLHRVRTKGTALSSAERAADELAQGFVAMEETAAAANYFFGQGDFEESGAALDDVIAWAKALKGDLSTYSKLDVDMGEDLEAAHGKVTTKARVTGKADAESDILNLMAECEEGVKNLQEAVSDVDYEWGSQEATELASSAGKLAETFDRAVQEEGKSGAALRAKALMVKGGKFVEEALTHIDDAIGSLDAARTDDPAGLKAAQEHLQSAAEWCEAEIADDDGKSGAALRTKSPSSDAKDSLDFIDATAKLARSYLEGKEWEQVADQADQIAEEAQKLSELAEEMGPDTGD